MMTPSGHGGLAAKNGLSLKYHRNNESLSHHNNNSSSTAATRSYFLNRAAERRCKIDNVLSERRCVDNIRSVSNQVIDKQPSAVPLADTTTTTTKTKKKGEIPPRSRTQAAHASARMRSNSPALRSMSTKTDDDRPIHYKKIVAEQTSTSTNTRPSRSLQLLKSKTAASRARSRSVVPSSPMRAQEEEDLDVSSIESNDDNEDANNCVLRVLLENATAKTGRAGMDVSKYIRILEDEWITDVPALRQVDGKTLDELLPILLSRELQRLIHQNEYNKFALPHNTPESTTHVKPLLERNKKMSMTRPSNSLHSLKSKIAASKLRSNSPAMRKMSQVSNQENVQRSLNKIMDNVPESIAFISPKSVEVGSSATNSIELHQSVKSKNVAASRVIQASAVNKLYDEMYALEAKFLVKGSKKEQMVAQIKSSSASVLDQKDTTLLPTKRSSALPNLSNSIPPKTRTSRSLQSLKNKTAASRVRSNSPSIRKMSPLPNLGEAEHPKSRTSSTLLFSTASTPPKLPVKVMMNVRPEYSTKSSNYHTSQPLHSLKSKIETSQVRTSTTSVRNVSFKSDTDSKKPLQKMTSNTSIASSPKRHVDLPAGTTTNLQCAAKKYRRQKRSESKYITMSTPRLDQKKNDATISSSLEIMDDDISVTASLFSATSIAAALPKYDIDTTKRSLQREKKAMNNIHNMPSGVNETKVPPPQPVTKTYDDQSSIASTITDTTSLFYGISQSMSGTSIQSISSRRREMIRLRKMRSVLSEY